MVADGKKSAMSVVAVCGVVSKACSISGCSATVMLDAPLPYVTLASCRARD